MRELPGDIIPAVSILDAAPQRLAAQNIIPDHATERSFGSTQSATKLDRLPSTQQQWISPHNFTLGWIEIYHALRSADCTRARSSLRRSRN